MGDAKAKGAGAGALTGAAAGSTFGPYGAAVGGVVGGVYGFATAEDTPEYQQPAMDPAYAMLLEQQKKQRIEATQAGLKQESASLTARYGAGPGGPSESGSGAPVTSADRGSLLARYGAMLAFAGGR